MNFQRHSSGTAKAGLATGITGTALGVLNTLTGNGGNNDGNNGNCNNGWNNGWGNWGAGPWGPMAWGGYAPFGFGGFGGWGGNWGGYSQPQTVVVNTNDDDYRRGRGHDDYYGGCSENQRVNRYELGLQQQIAEKDAQIALRDANTYNDQKNLELYKYFDGELKDVRRELAAQAVVNQKTADGFEMAKRDLDCCCSRLETAIQNEARERRCKDNQIITYTNATFYPKMVADVTTGTTTTQQQLYNPLSDDCCCGNKNNPYIQ